MQGIPQGLPFLQTECWAMVLVVVGLAVVVVAPGARVRGTAGVVASAVAALGDLSTSIG